MNPQKTRVLEFICPTGFYGAERWILALAKNFDSEKIQCDLAITLEKNSQNLELVKHYKAECAGVGDVFEIPMSSRFDINVIKRLVKLIKERDISIIHTHGYKSDILGVIAAKQAGIKCIITPHGFENSSDIKLRIYIWLGCKAMKFSDKIAPLSRQIIKDLINQGIDEKSIVYIQNGVDLIEVEATRIDQSLGNQQNDSKIIGFIGQMISRKNVIDILDVFDSLCRRHKNLELHLLGDGDQRNALEAHTSNLACRDKIKFLGFQKDRLKYLKQFDLFVMTSTMEGIPRCLMEAMAMGIPVAAYDIAGIDQLIKNNETGLLAELGDKEALEQNWEKLIFDSHLSENLAARAREFVHNQFSASRMAKEYLQLFNQLL